MNLESIPGTKGRRQEYTQDRARVHHRTPCTQTHTYVFGEWEETWDPEETQVNMGKSRKTPHRCLLVSTHSCGVISKLLHLSQTQTKSWQPSCYCQKTKQNSILCNTESSFIVRPKPNLAPTTMCVWWTDAVSVYLCKDCNSLERNLSRLHYSLNMCFYWAIIVTSTDAPWGKPVRALTFSPGNSYSFFFNKHFCLSLHQLEVFTGLL